LYVTEISSQENKSKLAGITQTIT